MKKLFRSEHNKMIFGVCGGNGEYINVDPTIVRLGFVALTIFAGMSILIYVIAAIIMPKEVI